MKYQMIFYKYISTYHPVSRKTKSMRTKEKLTVWSHCLSSAAMVEVSLVFVRL